MGEPTLHIRLYSRRGCQLCDLVKHHILLIMQDIPAQFEEVMITDDPVLEEKYMFTIPVVEMNGEEVFVTVDAIVTEEQLRAEMQRRWQLMKETEKS